MVRAKKRFLDMMNLKKQLRRLVIPIFVELALVMMLGATDTIMLSRHSDNAVAAVGFDNQIISLVFLVYQFMSMGAGILCSQYFGAGLRKRLVQVVGIALMLNFVMGAAVRLVALFLCSVDTYGDGSQRGSYGRCIDISSDHGFAVIRAGIGIHLLRLSKKRR